MSEPPPLPFGHPLPGVPLLPRTPVPPNLSGEGIPLGSGMYLDGRSAVAEQIHAYLASGDVVKIHVWTAIAGDPPLAVWPLQDLRRLRDQARRTGIWLRTESDPAARLLLSGAREADFLARSARNIDRGPHFTDWGRLLLYSLGAAVSVGLILLVLLPIAANTLAEILPPAGERALGQATLEQIASALSKDPTVPIGSCRAPAGAAALARMQDVLTAGVDLPYPVTVLVLDIDQPNAFALPGGYIVLFDGLLELADKPEEVMAILGHELGHVVARDPVRIALRTVGSFGILGLMFGDFAGGTVILFLANSMISANYSQVAEANADKFAHARMVEIGVDPGALSTLFAKLRAKIGDEDSILAHFDSHPELGDRIAAADAAPDPTEARELLTAQEWKDLKAICWKLSDAFD